MENMEGKNHLDILIAEDSPTQAAQLRFILEKSGYNVTGAANGQEALDIAMRRVPDVIITDVVMPGMDGYELCRRIRADQKLKHIPVILVTTLSDPTDVIRGLEVGANNFITKPYDEKSLVSRIQYLIANMKLRKNSTAEMGINVYFSGKNYFIAAERLQILDLLLSTYENSYNQNRNLLIVQKELTELNERLEDIVTERTAELSAANSRLKLELAERERAAAEKAKLQAQLNQAQKMESVGRLAGGVAHDYNNMLSVILGFTELARGKVEPSHPIQDDLKEVLSAASRTKEITRQLLAFARSQTIAPEVLDLNATVNGMLKMLRRLIGEDIDLAWLPGTGVWPVKLDPSQIDQIMANLCVNARDAISDVGKITIETENIVFDDQDAIHNTEIVPGEYVLLAVSDDGDGMDKETIERIFEPFFTTKEKGRGTGLGLSTVFGIVKQNNGFINVYSEPEKGTTFKIYLPRHAGSALEPTAKKSAAEIAPGRGETVLVVEDEVSILKMSRKMLETLGYQVLGANDPDEALSLAAQHEGEIHLLLTDVVMPGMNGRDLSERIREIRPAIKVLFMSGYSANVIAHRGVLDEGVHFIRKPYSSQALAVAVRNVLDA